jgi:hypothetical protein
LTTKSSTTKRKVKDEVSHRDQCAASVLKASQNVSPKDATPSKARGRNKSANPRPPAVHKESAKKEEKQKVIHEPEVSKSRRVALAVCVAFVVCREEVPMTVGVETVITIIDPKHILPEQLYRNTDTKACLTIVR